MKLWRSRPGEISPEPCWCLLQEEYLYIHDTLLGVLWLMLTEYRDDRHLWG